MSIASEISRLANDSAAIASAITSKGVSVPSGSGYDDYASLITSIPSGGFPDWIKDGNTHLWIDIKNDYQLDQQLRIRMKGTIDWGDGSTETTDVTTYTTFSHTYTDKGKYRIDLIPTSGSTFYLGGASSSYNVLGSTGGRSFCLLALYQAEIGTKSITTISADAFYYSRGLVRVYIPKTITSIGNYAFCYCYSLQEIEFEDSTKITSVGSSAFVQCCSWVNGASQFEPNTTTLNTTYRNCHCLPEVIIPATVTTLSGYVFGSMYGIKKMMCLPTTVPSANSNAFNDLPSSFTIIVPKGYLSTYQNASYWSSLASKMVEGGIITYSLTKVLSDNNTRMVPLASSYTAVLTAEEGYTLNSVTVVMDGNDITSTAYSNGVVSIANVTGNITITATAS